MLLSVFLSAAGFGVGAWRVFLGGLGPSPTLLAGPSLPKHSTWSARSGGCRSQGCHGYPTRSAPVLEAPPSFQAPSPSSSIVDEFKCG